MQKICLGAVAAVAACGVTSIASADTISFQFNDPAVPSTFQADAVLTDVAGGVEVKLTANLGIGPGDMLGFFFDLGDEALIGNAPNVGFAALAGLDTNVTATEFKVNSVRKIGGGNVIVGKNGVAFDGGVELGDSGSSGGMVTSATFVLSSSHGDLDVSDFFNQRFGLRVQSTGSDNEDSLKLFAFAPASVPEPGVAFASAGLLGGLALRRRRA